jgi:hypothetical protein
MSPATAWIYSAWYVHGIGGGTVDAGNLFLYEDCCVWACSVKTRWHDVAPKSDAENQMTVDRQRQCSPQELLAEDKRNFLVQRRDIQHAYLWDFDGGSAGTNRFTTTYRTSLLLELAGGEEKSLNWRFATPEERQAWKVPELARWLGDTFVEEPPPRRDNTGVLRRLLGRDKSPN